MAWWIWFLIGLVILIIVIKLGTKKRYSGESFGQRFKRNLKDCCYRIIR